MFLSLPSSFLNISEYAWMCLNKQNFEYALGLKHVNILDVAMLWIWQCYQYARVTQRSEYVRICFDRVLNISWVLNMAGFWIWNMQELHRARNMSQHSLICLNRTWIYLNMSEFLILDGSEHSTYNARYEVTLQINEYLLRDTRSQNQDNDLRWSALEK